MMIPITNADIDGPWVTDPHKVKVGDYIARVVDYVGWSPEILRVVEINKERVRCHLLWRQNDPRSPGD